jgi:hypothetical protein
MTDMDLVYAFGLLAISIAFLGGLIYAVMWGIVTPLKQLRKDAWDARTADQSIPPMFQKLLDKAMTERDAEQQRLKERITTLERIVVESHKRLDLSGAMERLQEQ